MVNLFLRSSNPSRFSIISPTCLISFVFSKFSLRSGLKSGKKSGSLGGNVAINAGSIVKLLPAGWQVPQVRPFPPKVSLKNKSLPQIGRASCRERVYVCGGGVPVRGNHEVNDAHDRRYCVGDR